MDYFSKYLKYKSKYLEIKRQSGGSDLDSQIQAIELDNLYRVLDYTRQYLSSTIPQDKFLNQEEIRSLIDTLGLEQLMVHIIILST